MAEYIDKQKLIDILEARADMAIPDYKPVLLNIAKFVQLLPAAEVEPVRHGYWIDCVDDYACDYIRCSACGAEYASWLDECTHTNFCPECGADMRGGADNG